MIANLRATTGSGLLEWDCPLSATQVQEILESAGRSGVYRLALSDSAGHLIFQVQRAWDAGTPPDALSEHDVAVTVPILVQGDTVAGVLVVGPQAAEGALAQTARLIAARLTDAWCAALEITSLASEIVHAYEELHLLYELGEALTGHLTVVQTAEIMLEKIALTLQAAWAELRFAPRQEPAVIRYGVQEDGPRVPVASGEHRLATTLRSGGSVIAQLLVVRMSDAAPFSSPDSKLLDAVGSLVGSALRNAQLYEELRRRADTDALTGLVNHRAFQERLDAALATAAAHAQSLAILLIDIDDFKLFNDTYGHLVGDRILRLTGEKLRDICRDNDVAGRYGGDEFVLLLTQTDRVGATAVAQRLLSVLGDQGVTVSGHTTLPLSLSIGCAVFPDDAQLKHDLLSHADVALYDIKHRGGNGVRSVGHVTDDPLLAASTNGTFGAMQGLIAAVDAKDRYTRVHSEVVTQGALLLAKRLGLSTETCSALRIAGLLHDVGKIGIPDRILRKPGRLEPDEYKIMQQHVALSELIIKEVPHLVDVLSAVANHHERFDGRGYPRGLRGDAIPLLGRIMAIADACSAMLMSRPYRKGLIWPEVVAELRLAAGTQFDPELVEPFISVVEESGMLADVLIATRPKHAAGSHSLRRD